LGTALENNHHTKHKPRITKPSLGLGRHPEKRHKIRGALQTGQNGIYTASLGENTQKKISFLIAIFGNVLKSSKQKPTISLFALGLF